jgi:aspartyl-tRNA(Asn)/glutamyl-tRNA(Gln) amidotransferase subunit B
MEAVIGLEIHAQLKSNTKAWCNCKIQAGDFENYRVCEICSAQPGTLPVPNKKVIELATKLAIATNCKLNPVSFFDRKNYFYPDLPKGYQITQFRTPIAEGGYLEVEGRKIRIQRIQLEEDTGKSTHTNNYSLINLNRAGTPLVEIVTEPDFRNAKESVTFLKKLHSILVYLDISIGNMQDGNMRCDVNLSMRESAQSPFGIRTEVKNLNSFKSVEKSIEFEKKRQTELIKNNQPVLQQTLLFDVDSGKTRVLRTKSDADDYRYFPEPDLTALILDEAEISKIRDTLPELPHEKLIRFQEHYSLSEYDAEVLTRTKELANFFEKTCEIYNKNGGESYKKVANWFMGDLLKLMKEAKVAIEHLKIDADSFASLILFVDRAEISTTVAKDVFIEMFDTGISAKDVIEKQGLKQNNDSDELLEMAREIIESSPDEVAQFKAGKDRVLGFFVGQIIKKTSGQANPKIANELVRRILSEK